MDKPWSFNHKTKKAFTVISPIDINKPEYQVCIPKTQAMGIYGPILELQRLTWTAMKKMSKTAELL